MFDFLGATTCRFKGHRWSKAHDEFCTVGHGHNPATNEMRKYKTCLRCGIEREVKTRAKKA